MPSRRVAANDTAPAPLCSGTTSRSDVEYWDELFGAVTARIERILDGPSGATPQPESSALAERMRSGLRECSAALEQLRAVAAGELARCRDFEQENLRLRGAVARALIDLDGSRAGESRARHLATHDPLTSLANRVLFRGRLDRALKDAAVRGSTLAVLYVDLDDFKAVNDTHGHDAGDELLRIVSRRLTGAIRSDDVVSRWGGDEFACLLTGLPGRDELSHLACKLFDSLSAPSRIGRVTLTVRPSIGIAMSPADGATCEELLGNADAAMYRAKRQRAGYAFFDERADVWGAGAD